MLKKLRQFFQKDTTSEIDLYLPTEEDQRFILFLKDLKVGELYCKDGIWTFFYSEEFKARSDEYYTIVGFPDVEKVYTSDSLWPFFLIRIPGLGQPRVREILEKENIDPNNEAQLLRRFGRKTIANPFELAI